MQAVLEPPDHRADGPRDCGLDAWQVAWDDRCGKRGGHEVLAPGRANVRSPAGQQKATVEVEMVVMCLVEVRTEADAEITAGALMDGAQEL